jgi:hypothetical protein
MSPVVPALRLDESHLGPAMLALNPAQRIFTHAKVFGGMSNKDAAAAAGYSTSSDDVLKATGSRLAHDPHVQEAIVECSKQLMRAEGAASVRVLVRLRDHGADDKIKLRAATELLDRCGGLSAATQHNIDVTHTHQLSEAALDQKILALAKEAGLTDGEARKLLISPDTIDAEFTEVPPEPEKTPEQVERAERYQRTNEREQQRARTAMSPEELAAHKRATRVQRAADAKAKYARAQQQTDIEDFTTIMPMSADGLEDIL